MVASLIALLNDHRLRHGMPKLGFVNPLLYSHRTTAGGGFKDITKGSNPGCSTEGFKAMKGYVPNPVPILLTCGPRLNPVLLAMRCSWDPISGKYLVPPSIR